ncbi:hypothetical protein LOD99_10305 [Oopsacas minuta]|uniref:Uncharacterized protein n=1 Tax=Oopsacas minuta TaxID=111878 RepID=A0AAV7KKC2_9METZ|nr:hypothetical protein LOD99_10305 [Oopsacas minuta]
MSALRTFLSIKHVEYELVTYLSYLKPNYIQYNKWKQRNPKNAEVNPKSAHVKELELDYSLKKQPILSVGMSEERMPIYVILKFWQCIVQEPRAIAVTENHVFVTDCGLHALFQFSDIKLVRAGTRGSGKGELNYPSGLCTDYNGDVYLADCRNHRVCISSDEPFFCCFDPAGNILISDHYHHQIKILSPSGELIHTIGREDIEEVN